jgi:hypothetical protein
MKTVVMLTEQQKELILEALQEKGQAISDDKSMDEEERYSLILPIIICQLAMKTKVET